MQSLKQNVSLEHLPDLIFHDYIFKYLRPTDIFNLGQCSKTLKDKVLLNAVHPVSTSLQCIKTVHKYFYKKSTVYDDIDRFKGIDKCKKNPVLVIIIVNLMYLKTWFIFTRIFMKYKW